MGTEDMLKLRACMGTEDMLKLRACTGTEDMLKLRACMGTVDMLNLRACMGTEDMLKLRACMGTEDMLKLRACMGTEDMLKCIPVLKAAERKRIEELVLYIKDEEICFKQLSNFLHALSHCNQIVLLDITAYQSNLSNYRCKLDQRSPLLQSIVTYQ